MGRDDNNGGWGVTNNIHDYPAEHMFRQARAVAGSAPARNPRCRSVQPLVYCAAGVSVRISA